MNPTQLQDSFTERTDAMVEVRATTPHDLVYEAHEKGVALPIEQMPCWGAFEATIPQRSHWGDFIVARDGSALAFCSLTAMDTHGYRYVRSLHGPVWAEPPSQELEAVVVEALARAVREREHSVAFMRLAIAHELPITRPVLSTVPYDRSVVMDLCGGDGEAILARMKPRGRRDVRKALRECPASVVDETAQGAQDFAEYYEVMIDTATRDGFCAAPASDYQHMLSILGPEHVRLFASRIEGKVVAWTIATMNDEHAVRYYAASSSEVRKLLVADKSIFEECVTLGKLGCKDYDHMGIGDDFSPSLKSLNTFKTKFSKDVVAVAPNRDVPLRKAFYQTLVAAKRVKSHIAH